MDILRVCEEDGRYWRVWLWEVKIKIPGVSSGRKIASQSEGLK
jgi:hypothetical protein